jgi:AraC family transcriptional regulator
VSKVPPAISAGAGYYYVLGILRMTAEAMRHRPTRDRIRGEGQHTLVQAASWCGSGIMLRRVRWICAEAELSWRAPNHAIMTTETGGTTRTEIAAGGEALFSGRDRAGTVSVVPAGVERCAAYQHADIRCCILWIRPEIARDVGLPNPPALMSNRAERIVSGLLTALADEVEAGHSPDNTYVEHLVGVVLHRVALLGGQNPLEGTRRPLDPATVCHVADYIDSNLDAAISLSDLARIAQMPLDYFARSFRAATGAPPYAYVLSRRLQRARELLQHSDHPISAIALDVGFANQSHLTATFHKAFGITPASFRKESRR